MPNPRSRNMPLPVTIGLVILAVVLVVIGIVYLAEPAGSLPSFFPGHQAGSAHHHSKHGFLAIILGIVALAGAWMTTGTKKAS